MARKEFPKSVKAAVILRATHGGNVICEKCSALAKRWQIDHVIADAHGGKPVIENAELICEACYSVKNPQDTTIAAKLKRQEAKALGVKTAPAKPIQSAGFSKPDKPKREGKPSLPPRAMFVDE
jgi:5-methylcytosine-specific restriction endonuclease McrA